MSLPVIAALGAPFASGIASALFGKPKAKVAVPEDLKQMRAEQIQLLRWLTGFGGQPTGLNLPAQPMASGGPVVGPGGPTADQVPALLSNGEFVINAEAAKLIGPDLLQLFNQIGAQKMALGGSVGTPMLTPSTTSQTGRMPGGSVLPPQIQNKVQTGMGGMKPPAPQGSMSTQAWNPQQRLTEYFGNYSVPLNALQGDAATSANRMLTQQSPEIRAFEAGQSALNGPQLQDTNSAFLQQMLSQNPAMAIQQLLQPQFEQNIAYANQTGGRFGSGNALMRGQAVAQNQANLAQLFGQGVSQQLQAAGQLGQQAQNQRSDLLNRLGLLGQLGASAGAGQRANVQQGFDIGTSIAAQNDLETQRRLQLLLAMLGQSQSASFNQPTVVE
jgi:hypothetical protein